jgi:uncharacterized Zn finger protein (UPF0148 family)
VSDILTPPGFEPKPPRRGHVLTREDAEKARLRRFGRKIKRRHIRKCRRCGTVAAMYLPLTHRAAQLYCPACRSQVKHERERRYRVAASTLAKYRRLTPAAEAQLPITRRAYQQGPGDPEWFKQSPPRILGIPIDDGLEDILARLATAKPYDLDQHLGSTVGTGSLSSYGQEIPSSAWERIAHAVFMVGASFLIDSLWRSEKRKRGRPKRSALWYRMHGIGVANKGRPRSEWPSVPAPTGHLPSGGEAAKS